jgi:hypothetical protein
MDPVIPSPQLKQGYWYKCMCVDCFATSCVKFTGAVIIIINYTASNVKLKVMVKTPSIVILLIQAPHIMKNPVYIPIQNY